MINSEETLTNAVDEIKNAWTILKINGKIVSKLDFAVDSIEAALQLQTRLDNLESLCKVCTFLKLYGPFHDGFYVMRVVLYCEKQSDALNFECVDVSTSCSQIAPNGCNLYFKPDTASEDIESSESSEEIAWQLPLPSTCESRESLVHTLKPCLMQMCKFHVLNDKERRQIRAFHRDQKDDKSRCFGSFCYKMVDEENGVYQLSASNLHTCKRI